MSATSPSWPEAIASIFKSHWQTILLAAGFATFAVAGGMKLYVDLVLTPKCQAIWAEPRLIARATYALKPQCERFTVPIRTPIPKDSELETATLAGGPK